MLQIHSLQNVLFIPRYDAVKAMRAMEKFTQEVGGYPFLYADIFMTRKEFEEMFDLTGKKNFVKTITKFGRNLTVFSSLRTSSEEILRKWGLSTPIRQSETRNQRGRSWKAIHGSLVEIYL